MSFIQRGACAQIGSAVPRAILREGDRVMTIRMDGVYAPSDDVVAREIAGEVIIIPLAAGIGDMEDELYTFNESGREIWERLDGATSLGELVAVLVEEYGATQAEIERDLRGLVEELVSRRILVEVSV